MLNQTGTRNMVSSEKYELTPTALRKDHKRSEIAEAGPLMNQVCGAQ